MGRRREGEGVYQTSSVKIYCLVCKFAHSLTHLYTTEQDMGREGVDYILGYNQDTYIATT